MNGKMLIPCLYLKDGKLYEDFSDSVCISDAPAEYAVKCAS